MARHPGNDLDLTPSTLERLRRQAAERSDYIDLSSSNPTAHGFIFPTHILRTLADEYWRVRRYMPDPKGNVRAREAIAQYYARRTPPLTISPEQVFITASTSEAYSLLFTLLTAPGDNVLAPVPSYPLFEHLASMHHITLRPYYLEPPRPAPQRAREAVDNWQLDATRLIAQVDGGTRAVLLISPHNPTGHVIMEKSAPPTPQSGARKARVGGIIPLPIIADEVFCEFPFAVPAVPPLGALHPDAPVFHLNGISKMFALPDLKLGWIAISGPLANTDLERLELLNDTLLSANSMAQFMLPALFDYGTDFVAGMREQIQYNLREALAALKESERIRVVPPMGGTYLFPEILDCDDEDRLLERMLNVGLFAHPGYFYDEERGCHLMISGLIETPRLLEGIERLRQVTGDVLRT